ncbi:MAG: DUF4185 domain-containing protein [Planctomycetales bacterium]|nr:DUF4185 domain-containing protein [Planctomycetales bacterium]
MSRCLLLRRLLAVVGVLALAAASVGRVRAEVSIAVEASPHVVKAGDYQARVDGDGCLTSLRIAGREFLAPGVGISRGLYLYRNGVLALPQIELADANTIVAAGEDAKIVYRFSDDGVTCTATNDSETPTAFFAVLSGELAAVLAADGRAVAPAVTEERSEASFALGEAKLQVRGLNRIWGPWQGPHQVCEALLAAGETRKVEFIAAKLSAQERAAVVALFAPSIEQPVTVFAPQDYQVIQRSTLEQGECLVAGNVTIEADAVEYRVLGESQHGQLPSGWQTAEFVKPTGGFSARVVLPAGGWYQLEVRAKQGDQVVAEARVERFGVGEVFVGAGQSNSTNCGELPTKQTSGMVASFGGDQWKLADDPQLGVADRSTGGSFWPAFGDAMYQRYGVPIGVAATGFGGTSVNQWQPDGDLFKWMMTRIEQLGPRGFRALLWHQGESDVDMPGDEYFLKLQRVIQASRDGADWQIPWFVAQATYHNMQRPRTDSIRFAQQRLWAEGVALRGPDTDLLQEDYRDLGGKGIHFSPKGLQKHGEMWAECVAPLVDLELGLTNKPNALAPVTAEQWPEADVLFHRDPQWLGGDDAYSLDLGDGRVAWFFGDSFVEPTTPGERRGTTMVRNSVGIQTGYDPTTAQFKAYWSHQGQRPSSLIPEDGENFYWPGGSVLLDGKVLMLSMRARDANADLNFETTGWGAVLLDQIDLPPDQWKIQKLDVPQNDFEVLVGSGSLVCEGDFVYAFSHSKRGTVLVRWPRAAAAAGDLSEPRWYDPEREAWIDQRDLTAAPAPIFAPGQTEFTVHRQSKQNRYLQVQFAGFPRTPIAYRSAEHLVGPWSPMEPLFAPAELLADDPAVMLYAGKLHPEQSVDGVALTYASNAFSLARVVDDNSLYYPRFARVRFRADAD